MSAEAEFQREARQGFFIGLAIAIASGLAFLAFGQTAPGLIAIIGILFGGTVAACCWHNWHAPWT